MLDFFRHKQRDVQGVVSFPLRQWSATNALPPDTVTTPVPAAGDCQISKDGAAFANTTNLPTHIDYPFIDNGKLLVRVVYNDVPLPAPTPPVDVATADDQTLVREGVGAFLKVFDDIKLREDAAVQSSAKNMPDVVIINADEFHKRVAEHEASRQRRKHMQELFGKASS